MMMRLAVAGLIGGLLGTSVRAQTLVWQEARSNAMALALSQGRLVLLLAGRHSCPNCNYMQFTVSESSSPPVRQTIEAGFVPWYCDVDDTNGAWRVYASGLGGFTLPLICVIDPARADSYLDRSTSTQPPDYFYGRLKNQPRAWLTNASVSRFWISNAAARVVLTNLTAWATNRIERSLDLSDPQGWTAAGTIVSRTISTNWIEPFLGGSNVFYRVQSRK